jgi:hypothetical protein
LSRAPFSPLVISFYTEQTPYQLEVLNLIRSCHEWGVDYAIEGVPSWGSWELNCFRKPQFILEKLLETKRPIFWVDADATFKKSPDFSFLEPHDFSFLEVEHHSPWMRFRAGSVFINYTEKGVGFALAWVEYCHGVHSRGEELSFVDQKALFALMQEPWGISRFPLPPAYCQLCDEALGDPVIEHFQASRRFKGDV